MSQVVRFASTNDVVTASYTAGNIPASETTAITLKDLDVDSTSAASVAGNTQGTLFIKFVKGTGGNLTVKLYGSYLGDPTATDWYQETSETDSSGVLTLNGLSIVLSADATVMWHFPIGSVRAYKITVSASAGTGTLTIAAGLRSN